MTKDDARAIVMEQLQALAASIGGAWPLVEAFTDLDEHPEEDESGGFNYIVGYVTGLCEAFDLDVTSLCMEVEKPKRRGRKKA